MEIPGVMVYGATPEEAKAKARAPALCVIADRSGPDRYAFVLINPAALD